MRLTRFD